MKFVEISTYQIFSSFLQMNKSVAQMEDLLFYFFFFLEISINAIRKIATKKWKKQKELFSDSFI